MATHAPDPSTEPNDNQPASPDLLTADISQALTRTAGYHGITLDPRILEPLTRVVAACITETPSTAPDDCRWTVTEDRTYLEGHDHLAGAIATTLDLSADGDPSSITLARKTP